jgi:hypothetical protein
MCVFMPKYHWLSFFDERISRSRWPAAFGGGRGSDQGRIHDRAAAQQRAGRFEMNCHRFEHRLRQPIRLEQVPEVGSSSRPGSDRGRVQVCRTHPSTGCRRALQTECTTAAGNRCATSRRSETGAARPVARPSDSAARSVTPGPPTAPPPPSRSETRRASCASSSRQSQATQSPAARPSRPSVRSPTQRSARNLS